MLPLLAALPAVSGLLGGGSQTPAGPVSQTMGDAVSGGGSNSGWPFGSSSESTPWLMIALVGLGLVLLVLLFRRPRARPS